MNKIFVTLCLVIFYVISCGCTHVQESQKPENLTQKIEKLICDKKGIEASYEVEKSELIKAELAKIEINKQIIVEEEKHNELSDMYSINKLKLVKISAEIDLVKTKINGLNEKIILIENHKNKSGTNDEKQIQEFKNEIIYCNAEIKELSKKKQEIETDGIVISSQISSSNIGSLSREINAIDGRIKSALEKSISYLNKRENVNIEISKKEAKLAQAEANKIREDEINKKFAGANFGIGIAISSGFGRNKIESASLKGKPNEEVIRVDNEKNLDPKIMLESHYFWALPCNKDIGMGPFLGVQLDPSSDEIINSYAFGYMVGFKRKGDSGNSFNLGIGLNVNTNVKVLGDGFEEGKSLPSGETEIRYKSINQLGWLFIVSFGF